MTNITPPQGPISNYSDGINKKPQKEADGELKSFKNELDTKGSFVANTLLGGKDWSSYFIEGLFGAGNTTVVDATVSDSGIQNNKTTPVPTTDKPEKG